MINLLGESGADLNGCNYDQVLACRASASPFTVVPNFQTLPWPVILSRFEKEHSMLLSPEEVKKLRPVIKSMRASRAQDHGSA